MFLFFFFIFQSFLRSECGEVIKNLFLCEKVAFNSESNVSTDDKLKIPKQMLAFLTLLICGIQGASAAPKKKMSVLSGPAYHRNTVDTELQPHSDFRGS